MKKILVLLFVLVLAIIVLKLFGSNPKPSDTTPFISNKVEENVELYMENHYQKNFPENKVACASSIPGKDDKYIYTWMYCKEYGPGDPASASSGAIRFEYQGQEFEVVALTEQAEGDDTEAVNKQIFGVYYDILLLSKYSRENLKNIVERKINNNPAF